jgi:VWFA-related protein
MPASPHAAHPPRPNRLARRLATLAALILAAAPLAFIAQTNTPAPATPPQEITSKDVQPTFKLQAERNLVMVRVVVRDAKGAIVDTLRKEDFQLYDHGKSQTILHFSLEKPTLKPAEPALPKAPVLTAKTDEDVDETAMPVTAARRFMAMYFDDVNTPFENLAQARQAADHFLSSSVQPGDRAALYTSSGLNQVDFTDDLKTIHEALFKLQPRPIAGRDTTCGAIPPYQAYLIVEQQDTMAVAEAADEYLNCNPCPAQTAAQQQMCQSTAQSMVQSEAARSLSRSEVESMAALRGIETIVRRLTSLPGQRSMVVVSAGFLTETLRFELSQIADRALRAGVVVNALDARGLWTDPVTSDASRSNFAATLNAGSLGVKHQMLLDSAQRQTDGMQSLALDTGGVFFNNNNDLEAGFRKTSGLPDSYYLLAFSPQNLKLDGAFHPLQVKLVAMKGLQVQARKGYYAPRRPVDPTAQEKEEIQEAVYSKDETHELPIEVHTQYFMKNETDARISVLTHLDLHDLRFRKQEDRNLDNLTFVTVVFDQDGHQITGQEKLVELRFRDLTLQRYEQTGITIRTAFDVKPGTYLVRAVVRDSESGEISGLNRTVEIPY